MRLLLFHIIFTELEMSCTHRYDTYHGMNHNTNHSMNHSMNHNINHSTYDERKELFENIKVLVKPEQDEIFRMIRKSKEAYTENSNGLFFDLSSVSEDTFYEMKEYIKFCLKTRQEHDERLKELEALRTQNETYVASD